MYTCIGCSAQLVVQELARIGIEVVVKELPIAEMLRRIKTPGASVDLYVGGVQATYADPSEFLNHVVPLGYSTEQDFFSTRIGCQLYQPIYGMDLGALCVRRT